MDKEKQKQSKNAYLFGTQVFSALFLGIILPMIVISISLYDMNRVMSSLDDRLSVQEIGDQVSGLAGKLNHSNDYALYTVMFLERTNQSVIINKQLIRSLVIMIGLAVICIGLAFAVLGVKESGMDVNGAVQGLSFDVKAGTPGIAAIVIGGIMVTIGGVWPGQYTTNQSPSFSPMHASPQKVVAQEPKVSLDEIKRRCTSVHAAYPGRDNMESCIAKYSTEIWNGK